MNCDVHGTLDYCPYCLFTLEELKERVILCQRRAEDEIEDAKYYQDKIDNGEYLK